MRKIIFILLFLTNFPFLKAQSITQTPEWKQLLTDLKTEKWQEANDLSNQCLKTAIATEPGSNMIPILRYMVIFSESGLMNDGKLSQEKALLAVKGFEGMVIALPGHPISVKRGFNSITMHDEKTDSLFITATNSAATNIFAFEYVALRDVWPVDDFKNNAGKMCRLSGTLTSITVEGHILPRFRIIISDGQYQILN